MVSTVCRIASQPQGVTLCCAAHWLAPKSVSETPNLILVRTTVLEVYSVNSDGGRGAPRPAGSGHIPTHTMCLEHTETMHGVVQAIAVLKARRAGRSDSLVLVFDGGHVCVLAWDPSSLSAAPTSLHVFNPVDLPVRGRTLATGAPALARSEPSGRAVALLFMSSIVAVLPAMSAAAKRLTAQHTAAGAGNSYVIDLTTHGIRDARDMVFLYESSAMLLVLHDVEYTWNGLLHHKKDTCVVKAIAVSTQRPRQPVLWTAKRLPSDCFAVAAVPSGGVIVLSPSLIVYQNKSARLCLSTHAYAIPGVVPEAPDVDVMTSQEAAMQHAIEMAERYATNVAPVSVPEAAARAQRSDVHADLSSCRVEFLTPASALVATQSGRMLHLSLKAELAGRICKITLKETGTASPPSALCMLSKTLVFLGSWLGHSNLLVYDFKATESSPRKDGKPSSPTAAGLVTVASGAASVKPEELTQGPLAASTVSLPSLKSAQDVASTAPALVADSTGAAGLGASGAGSLPGSDVMAALLLSGVKQMQEGIAAERQASQSMAAAEGAAMAGAGGEEEDEGLEDFGAVAKQALAEDGVKFEMGTGRGVKRARVAELMGQPGGGGVEAREPATDADPFVVSSVAAGTPGPVSGGVNGGAGLQLAEVAGLLTPGGLASVPTLEARAPSALPGLTPLEVSGPSPHGSSRTLGAPGLVSSSVALIPGLAPISTAPAAAATEEEPALAEDDPAAQDDHDDLEEMLYHPPSGDLDDAAGRRDTDTLVLHGEDRLPQLGPVSAFAIGGQAACGVGRDENRIMRGAPQLLACAGQGSTGALALIRQGILPAQDSAVSFEAAGRCTGVWAIYDDPVSARAPDDPSGSQTTRKHRYMIISFESTSFVYIFEDGKRPRDVSDLPTCEFSTDQRTIHVCTMFRGEGAVQVCAEFVKILGGMDLIAIWELRSNAQALTSSNEAIVAACHSQSYLLLRLSDSGAVLLQETEYDSNFQELSGTVPILRQHFATPPGMCVSACCLYEDESGWLEAVLAGKETGPVMPVQEGPAKVYLCVCRANGTLQLYSLPEMVEVAAFGAVEEGEPVVNDAHASSALEDITGRRAAPAAHQVIEIRLDSFCASEHAPRHPIGQVPAASILAAHRPMLLLRTRDERLYVYRFQIAVQGGSSILCLRRQPFNWLMQASDLEPAKDPHVEEPHLVRFSNIGVCHCSGQCTCANSSALYQGVFVCGKQPVWLLAHRGTYRGHPMDVREAPPVSGQKPAHEPIVAMAAWNQEATKHGFLLMSGDTSELRFCRMQRNVRLHMATPTLYKGLAIYDKSKKRHEGVTPHFATWHAPSSLFFVATSRRLQFQPHLPLHEEAVDDPHAAFSYKLAEEVARVGKGEVRFQLRGVAAEALTMACEIKFKPLEHVLCLEAVKLSVPTTDGSAPQSELYIAAGVGELVTEDWASSGAVYLYQVKKDRTQGFDGKLLTRWSIVTCHRREFAGPVTALASSSGNLIVAYGHNVELYRWTGSSLQLGSPLPSSSTRLVSSLAIIKNQYMLVGNLRKGLTFVHAKEATGALSLVAQDFGCSDSICVDFLLAGTTVAFLQADSRGNVAVFRYHREQKPHYDPPGIRALPVGRYHLGHKVTALHRAMCFVDLSGQNKIGYGALLACSSGALGWLLPISPERHTILANLSKALVTGITHAAGTNPRYFRSLAFSRPLDSIYGEPAPLEGVLDGDLLYAFAAQSRQVQAEVARKAEVPMNTAIDLMRAVASHANFF